jgi:hypothetical protein
MQTITITVAKAIFSFGLTVGLALAQSSEVPPAAAESAVNGTIEKELQELHANMLKAYEGNIDALIPYLHPDILVTWQDGVVSKGPEEVRKYYQNTMQGPRSVVYKVTGNPVVEERRIFGDQIVSIGNMNDTFVLRNRKNEALKFNSRFSSLVVRHEGKLKLAGMHMSVNALDNPITNAAVSSLKKVEAVVGITGLVLGLVLGRLSVRKRDS